MHPRTRKTVEQVGISLDGITVMNPVGFLEFLQLESNARLVLTDSGGVQEETCILGVPCVTLRENTERPETIEVGANVLAGTGADRSWRLPGRCSPGPGPGRTPMATVWRAG